MYSAADVTAIPSLNDNLPQVGIESLSCGTPAVLTKTGGLQEQISDGEVEFGVGIEPTSLSNEMLYH